MFRLTFDDDGFDEKTSRSEVELIIEVEAFGIIREDDVLRSVRDRRN